MARLVPSVIKICITIVFISCNRNSNEKILLTPDVHKSIPVEKLIHSGGKTYHDGKVFTGVGFELFNSGDTATVVQFLNGQQHGLLRRFYPNGKPSEKRTYQNGNKVGIHYGWYENAQPKFVYHFQNDEYHGEVNEWLPDGSLFKIFHYDNGQESGRQQMWWPDGSVRANYVVKNGEQFGLIGRKLCVNSYHENK